MYYMRNFEVWSLPTDGLALWLVMMFHIRIGTSIIVMVKHFIKTYRWPSWWASLILICWLNGTEPGSDPDTKDVTSPWGTTALIYPVGYVVLPILLRHSKAR